MSDSEIKGLTIENKTYNSQREQKLTFEDLRQLIVSGLEKVAPLPFLANYVYSDQDHLVIDLQKLVTKHISLQKDDLDKKLLQAAKNSFVSFLYYLTMQQAATRRANIEAETDRFLDNFQVAGSKTYHFHLEGTEYFVEIREYQTAVNEPEPKKDLKKYKHILQLLQQKTLQLQQAIASGNEPLIRKLLQEMALLLEKCLADSAQMADKDFQTIQKLQQDLAVLEELQPYSVKNPQGKVSELLVTEDEADPVALLENTHKQIVSPVTVQNNFDVPGLKKKFRDAEDQWHEIVLVGARFWKESKVVNWIKDTVNKLFGNSHVNVRVDAMKVDRKHKENTVR